MKRVVLITALVLSACVPQDDQGPRRDYLFGNEYAENLAGFMQDVDPAFPRGGITYAFADVFYGVQVEYFAPDGISYLWFRGNRAPLRGEWNVQGSGFGEELCFRYGPNTRDAITGIRGGKWECRRLASERQRVVSFLKGDPFGLSRGQLPRINLRRCQLPAPMQLMTRSFSCL